MSTKHDCVAIVSGGLDSTTLVYDLIKQGHAPHCVSFDYGQRHSKELQFAAATARRLGLRHDIVDLTGITKLISNSALTSQCICNTGPDTDGPDRDCPQHGERPTPGIEVPEGHYAEENMKKTVVPNRNMIMISIAAGIAVNNSYAFVATGVHAGDHFVYPDCRPRFVNAAAAAIVLGNMGFGSIDLIEEGDPLEHEDISFLNAPYIYDTKAEIAYKALRCGVPLHLTWSCYKGEQYHCGRCGTCVERLEAIDEAQTRYRERIGTPPADETVYLDNEFWREAIKKNKTTS